MGIVDEDLGAVEDKVPAARTCGESDRASIPKMITKERKRYFVKRWIFTPTSECPATSR